MKDGVSCDEVWRIHSGGNSHEIIFLKGGRVFFFTYFKVIMLFSPRFSLLFFFKLFFSFM